MIPWRHAAGRSGGTRRKERKLNPWPRPLGRFIEAQHEGDPHAVLVTVEYLHPAYCPRPCPLCGPAKAPIDDKGVQP